MAKEVASAKMVRDLRKDFEAFKRQFEKLLVNPSFDGTLKIDPGGNYLLDLQPLESRVAALEQILNAG